MSAFATLDRPRPPRAPQRAVRRASLVPDALWPWVLPMLGCVATMFCGLAVITWHKAYPLRPESWIIEVINGPHVPRHVYRLGLFVGSPRFFAVVVVGLAVWAITRRRWDQLVCCASVPATVVLVEKVLKPAIDRHIADGFYAFPSGTVAAVAAWTTLAWLLAVPAVRDPVLRLALAVALFGVMGITGVAVVGAHWHYPFDAMAGVCVGAGVVLSFAAMIDVATRAHRYP